MPGVLVQPEHYLV